MSKLEDTSRSKSNILSRVVRRLRGLLRVLVGKLKFSSSKDHWEETYAGGGTSGGGSYGRLAEFKAEILNNFIEKNNITSIIELGCGDGNQLSLARYPKYIGCDVSGTAISMCREKFAEDTTKQFIHYTQPDHSFSEDARSDVAMSLDVIFHLVEDSVFDRYMTDLFSLGKRFVVIYSSDTDKNPAVHASHIRHRKFTNWVDEHAKDWTLDKVIKNRHPFKGDFKTGSRSDFYIYKPTDS